VREAALLLSVIAGADARDAATVDAVVQDYATALVPGALRGKRLGVVRSLAGENAKVLALFEEALKAMRDAGAVIIDPVVLPHQEELGRPAFVAMLAEFRSALNAYLADRGAQVRSLAEVMAFNQAHREQEMPHFAQEFFETAEKLGTEEAVAMAAEARMLVKRLSGPEGIDAALREHSLDALICPTNDPVHRTDLLNGDTRGRVCSSPSAIAGYPHLTVPMGFVDDLPIGLSFMGTAWGERGLLAIGHGFEEVMPAFREPRFLR
jgi:amidase